jgi:hypothetical protein
MPYLFGQKWSLNFELESNIPWSMEMVWRIRKENHWNKSSSLGSFLCRYVNTNWRSKNISVLPAWTCSMQAVECLTLERLTCEKNKYSTQNPILQICVSEPLHSILLMPLLNWTVVLTKKLGNSPTMCNSQKSSFYTTHVRASGTCIFHPAALQMDEKPWRQVILCLRGHLWP